MVKTVIKRDGTIEQFVIDKVYTCIEKAFTECGKKLPEGLKPYFQEKYNLCEKDSISVEEIQDDIENYLMSVYPSVARIYIIYRANHKAMRENQDSLTKSVSKKLMALDVENQNANVDEYSFGGRIGEASRIVTKDYALKYCMSKKAKNNHLNNEIYIHDLDSYAVGMHNCFNGNTKFITKNGVIKFNQCRDGQSVEVIDKDGNWRTATVHTYGKQKMYDLTFKSISTTKTVRCTRNHRWILKDGTTTDNINIGDSLLLLPELNKDYNKDTRLWCFGFVLGDGCDVFPMKKNKKEKSEEGFMNVRLCNNKTEYLDNFLSCGWSIRQSHDNGDITLSTPRIGAYKQIFFENKLWRLMSYNDLCNIMTGYISADGHLCANGSISISTADERACEFIEYASSIAGYYVWSKRVKNGDTNYKKDRTLYDYHLVTSQQTNHVWTLIDIKSSKCDDQTAWCVDEPETHTFTLDGGMVTGNCLSIPFDQLFHNGFNVRNCDIRKPSSISTGFQLLAVIFQIQSLQQFGGVSATHLDWTMVPLVRASFIKAYKKGLKYIEHNEKIWDKEFANKVVTGTWDYTDITKDKDTSIIDEMWKAYPNTYEYAMDSIKQEALQSAEGMYHNLNTLQSRSGNQLPFTSVNYGTCPLEEGRIITDALLQGSLNGVGKHHRTPIFPCGIFQYMKEVNDKPGTPNYDLKLKALKSTSKRLYPNYANVDWTNNAGYDVNDPRTYFSTMGCRTANGFDINGFGQLKDGRGNICPVTIIMPTLAMEANRDVETFMKLLDKKIGEAKDMLIERYEWICKQNPKSASFMWENVTMAGYVEEEGIRSALKHGTLALGQLGLAETLQLLIDTDHTTEEGMELAKRIEELFLKRTKEFKEQYKLNFGVYYTPAESLCHNALKKFRDKYGVIENVSDKDFFTNSMHVPVWHQMTPFEKIDIESQLTGYSNAGCITYVELKSGSEHNIEALETMVDYAMDKDIPYFAINIPNDLCLECGYTGEFNDCCPECGSNNIQQLRRVTGYLTGNYKTAFNKGKVDEVEHRVRHVKEIKKA